MERSFGTAQDRWVKELRLAGVRTLEQANDLLEQLLPGQETHWFSMDQLSPEQLGRLCGFLEQEYGSSGRPPFLLEVVRSQLD